MKKSELALILVLSCIAVLILVFMAVALVSTSQTDNSSVSSYEEYFNPQEITKVDIKIDPEVFTYILDKTPNKYLPCTVVLNGDAYPNVGIKVKGNTSLDIVRNSPSNRYGFKIKADAFGKQTIAGLDCINLNAELNDATMMREYLAYDMMKNAGVKTPLFSYAAVYVNGEYWGFYLMVEDIKSSFIKRNYGEIKGNLFKPEGTKGIVYASNRYGPDLSANHHGGHLEYVGDDVYLYDEITQHSVIGVDPFASVPRIVKVAKNIDSGTDLEKYVNMDEVIAYFAVNAAIANTDSYTNQGETHNFYIYEDGGKITIFPWDFDAAFGPFFLGASNGVNLPIDTPVQMFVGVTVFERLPLLKKIVEIPEYREKYHEKLRMISENFMGDQLIQRIDTIAKAIRPYMEKDPNLSYRDISTFDVAVENLKKYVDLRTKSVMGQLNGTIPSTYENQKDHPELLIDPGDLSLDAIGSVYIWKTLWNCN